MDYRDERDALRAKRDALEQELVAARADAAGKERLEKELAALKKAAAPRLSRPTPVIAIGAGLALLTCGGAVVWLRWPAPPPTDSVESVAQLLESVKQLPPPSDPATAPRLKLSFDSGGLAALDKDDAGIDGVVAITFEDSGRGIRSYAGVALSGKPLIERWRLGPYGARAPHVWTTARRALIIDEKHDAHVIDTDKGRELAVVSGMTEEPSRVCIRNAQAWITGLDEKSIAINLESGAASVGAQLLKGECAPPPDAEQPACRSISAALCGGSAPSLPGFALEVALANERAAVAVGIKSPGTADVIAAGFDPKTRAIRWRSPIADDEDAEPLGSYPPIVAALDDDLFVAIERHHITGTSSLRAFDAKTGERRFTYSFPSTVRTPPLAVVLGADRIFTTSWGNLYVVDRVTGKELERIENF